MLLIDNLPSELIAHILYMGGLTEKDIISLIRAGSEMVVHCLTSKYYIEPVEEKTLHFCCLRGPHGCAIAKFSLVNPSKNFLCGMKYLADAIGDSSLRIVISNDSNPQFYADDYDKPNLSSWNNFEPDVNGYCYTESFDPRFDEIDHKYIRDNSEIKCLNKDFYFLDEIDYNLVICYFIDNLDFVRGFNKLIHVLGDDGIKQITEVYDREGKLINIKPYKD